MRALAGIALAALGLAAGAEYPGADDLDRVIGEAISAGEIPGAVVEIGQQGEVRYRKAYGARALKPAREAMTEDTIFDAASLTKVVATASAVMKLFEQGRVRLNDPVTRYLEEFQGGKSEITVRQLLTHFSGLRPDLDLKPAWSGYETGITKALQDRPVAGPGERFIYSDINFILLGEMVRRLSGQPLPDYVRERIFEPLGMTDTRFQPPASVRSRIAPTEIPEEGGPPLRGVVHDETTRYMGGIAGHAGLFTTAGDLGRFAAMILGEGELGGVRVFERATVRKFTTPQSPADQPVLRGLGWDIDSPYSANRGELFPIGSYGHTGFTGTSLWIDPSTRSYVVLLTNSVHPRRRAPISSLRSRVATLVARHAGITEPGSILTGYNETLVGIRRVAARNGVVENGIDVLRAEGFARLQGKRVGLITNHTGLGRDGKRNVDLMIAAGVKLERLFSPEHGISGRRDDENIADSRDEATGLPVRSLYQGGQRRPQAEQLKGLDVLVFDIQDIGTRFYTYMCTLLYAIEEAAKLNLPVLVLDRPNPITGVRVEGPMIDREAMSFVGCHALPLRHGMTLGEIALMANAENGWKANVEVVRLKGWQRGDWFDSTGQVWVDPSPNMRSLNAALLYPGVGMLEYARDYSVGRGTDSPFEQVGAAWIKGPELAAYLNRRSIPGIRVYPTRLSPTTSNLAGQTVDGIRLVITQRELFSSSGFGLELAAALEKLYPGRMALEANLRLIGSRKVIEALKAGEDPRTISQRIEAETAEFLVRRQRYLLY